MSPASPLAIFRTRPSRYIIAPILSQSFFLTTHRSSGTRSITQCEKSVLYTGVSPSGSAQTIICAAIPSSSKYAINFFFIIISNPPLLRRQKHSRKLRRTNRNREKTLSRLPSCGATAYSQYSECQCGARPKLCFGKQHPYQNAPNLRFG